MHHKRDCRFTPINNYSWILTNNIILQLFWKAFVILIVIFPISLCFKSCLRENNAQGVHYMSPIQLSCPGDFPIKLEWHPNEALVTSQWSLSDILTGVIDTWIRCWLHTKGVLLVRVSVSHCRWVSFVGHVINTPKRCGYQTFVLTVYETNSTNCIYKLVCRNSLWNLSYYEIQ